jgi:A/G-specific adenine glycosylase
LPWQGTRNPYAIWISEIMLAQTRVRAVIPYYHSFVKEFPNVRALARATADQVLKAWEGLGYYARARHLHAAAKIIVGERNGRFPRRALDWQTLPGIGRYTAAAIAAFAFEDPAPALDTNVRRILARVYCYRRPLTGVRTEQDLAERYAHAIGKAAPSDFLQAMMDLGQTVCLPADPHCEECPLASCCLARKAGWQKRLPVRPLAKRIPHFQVAAAVIQRNGRVLLAKRKADALLGGMWEFPGGKRKRGETLSACLLRELREELGVHVRVRERLWKIPHAFSHFRITLHVFRCDSLRGTPRPLDAAGICWVRIADLSKFPMGKADRTASIRLAQMQ